MFLTVVTIFYFFKEGAALVEAARSVSPLEDAQTTAFFDQFRQVALGIFWGSLITCGFHGITSALGYWIFGVQQVVILGLVTSIAAFIPLVGTAVVWVPLVIGLWLQGHNYQALGLAIWCLAIVGAGDTVLRPLFSKGRMAIPKLLLFLTIFGGLQLLGAKGLLLGPLVGSLAVTAINLLRSRDPSGEAPAPGPGA